MKNNPESGEFCCLHICLFDNGKAIHFWTTLTPLRLLFLLSSFLFISMHARVNYLSTPDVILPQVKYYALD